mmetsp:Transcript_12588/g.30905  ORF Transcript_12588/g.30905 Transcript_12588/m.30905 type:complete len:398 (-) Transcript_12588:382-1575(-)|eukprot:CAMPEP_0206269664 /NCGR_PEP_ID=MMETSP0047_2-20121206/32430_1 /ASSEMBLY_ACC=CAM_ASM_000192 /TAXON_ID=195065 /ORGANISM="Chroomonas mesostigmatica_cf, Strain CCMP1168" /LENGTH=397 /DNA_ID=CAMNT_0053698203 /DNA_START=169 /DNA_END=1362 /DNA_ORIENTATION=+
MDSQHIDELKELVKASLAQTGVLSNIKAQLRAAVFKVVNADEGEPPKPPSGKAAELLATSEGALAADLVREFLEYYELQSSLAVLVPEANLDDSFPGRGALADRLGLGDKENRPLLVELLSAHMSRGAGGGRDMDQTPVKTMQSMHPSKQLDTPSPTPSPPQAHASKADASPTPSGTDDSPHHDADKYGFGGASQKEEGSASGLATLAGMPPITGKKPGSLLGDLPGLPGVKALPGGGLSKLDPMPTVRIESPELDEDDELSSTTKRITPIPKPAEEAKKESPPSKNAVGSPEDSPGDRSMEGRKQEMMRGAFSAEKAMRGSGADLAIELSDDDLPSDDIVEEDIIMAESDGDMSPAYGGAKHDSLSESANELSVSDRSVDGSMALDMYDHVEPVGK